MARSPPGRCRRSTNRVDRAQDAYTTYFEWLVQVCAEPARQVMRAHDMLDDLRWSDMYERGLTPAQAAEHARREGLA